MKKNPLVSVCIPVFNSEKTLPRLLESLVLQSFENFEVVIVDDGSPCKTQKRFGFAQNESFCKKIVKEFSKKAKALNKNISFSLVVHSKNFGLVEARRSCVLNAKAPYIFFADSDDVLPHDALEILYKAAMESGADIVHGRAEIYNEGALALCRAAKPATAANFASEEAGASSGTRNIATVQNEVLQRTPNQDFINERRKKIYNVHPGVLEGHEIFESYFVNKTHSGFLWGKLFRREVLLSAFEQIPSVFCVMAEDVLIYFYASHFAQKYLGISNFVYFYDISGGITSKKKVCDLGEWQRVISVSSVFTILYSAIGAKDSDENAIVLTEDEKKELRRLCLYYVSNNLKQLHGAVIPELQAEARSIMGEWWGEELVCLVEKAES
ncbi:glycosyltransferase family 2 protein [Treponema pectinovorum]|uniref:glycosyltransferase family 2 protein n=1 Tax=Treponema pectinovorum TaxID=164 RepID=UPI0011F35DE5|nr:glycosyltransferase family 2 protein [Treponema pectinovorum]